MKCCVHGCELFPHYTHKGKKYCHIHDPNGNVQVRKKVRRRYQSKLKKESIQHNDEVHAKTITLPPKWIKENTLEDISGGVKTCRFVYSNGSLCRYPILLGDIYCAKHSIKEWSNVDIEAKLNRKKKKSERRKNRRRRKAF